MYRYWYLKEHSRKKKQFSSLFLKTTAIGQNYLVPFFSPSVVPNSNEKDFIAKK